jgi:hypothetical protein
MVDGWKSEVLRAAMAANNEACGDYQNKKEQTLELVKTVVDRAIEKDIYVVIDWHSHQAHQQQAAVIDFFVREMKDYHNKPNVIFEIYNEPPDSDANQWARDVKPYSQAVITAIRNANANNLILVGTPYLDQDPDIATSNPVTGDNLAYVLHFYAAEHTLEANTLGSWRGNSARTFRAAATNALNANYPLFVSEYGSVNPNGNGSVNSTETNKWHAFMDEHKISSCYWSINNKPEGASAFISSFNTPTSGSDASWTNQSNMTESGKYIYNKLASYVATADWRNNPLPQKSSSSSETPSSSSRGNSSSSGNPTPITVSKIANANSVQSINNGVSLQVLNNATLEIFSLNGKLFRKMDFASGVHSVQLSDLPKGLYIVKVQFGSRKEVLYVPIR